MKLDKKSFNEKALAADRSTVFEMGVDIDSSNYIQMFHGVCIHTPITTSHTKVTGMKIFQPSRMIWS
jgi:hypothetical protein